VKKSCNDENQLQASPSAQNVNGARAVGDKQNGPVWPTAAAFVNTEKVDWKQSVVEKFLGISTSVAAPAAGGYDEFQVDVCLSNAHIGKNAIQSATAEKATSPQNGSRTRTSLYCWRNKQSLPVTVVCSGPMGDKVKKDATTTACFLESNRKV